MADSTCIRCGGFLDGGSNTCRYCGAAQPLPNGFIALTDDGVLTLLRERVTGLDSTSLHPAIPPKKLAGVRKVHAPYLPEDETVLAVYDGTVFGSATDGFFVTSKRIGFKNQTEGAQFFEWAHIDPDEVYVDGTRLAIGPGRIDTLYSSSDDALWQWSEAISTIARSARPERSEEEATGPTAWDAMPSCWPPQRHESHSDEVERLQRKPYAGFTSCSVVDTQVSGHLIVVCADASVELRHASNGAPYRAFQASDPVLSARFSPSGGQLAVGGLDRKATLYDVASGRVLGATPTMTDSCDEIAWLGAQPMGTPGRLAIASQRGELWIVDGATMQPTHRILGPDPSYHHLGGIAARRDGRVVFISVGSRLGAFDTTAGALLWRFDDALLNAARLAVSPRGDVLVAAGPDGVALFDARTGQPGARYPLACPRNVSWPDEGGGLFSKPKQGLYSWSPRPRFSPLGDLVAVQNHVGNLVFIDTTTYAAHATPRDQGRAWIEDVAWFADGNHLVVGSSDNSIAIWRVRPLTRLLHTSGPRT
jgi:WD40 repeat protein